MKYLCLGYHDHQTWAAMTDTQRAEIVNETLAYGRLLHRNGHVLDDTALEDARSATTLRFDSGKVSITDGPFAETQEQLGGVMLLEARDLNEAIHLMSQLPCMRVGCSLEIRPVQEIASPITRAESLV